METTRPQPYSRLEPLRDNAFPKICARCYTTYRDVRDFVERTSELKNPQGEKVTGLAEVENKSGEKCLVLMRNCPCLTTLAVFCKDRRDHSSRGSDRRMQFAEMLDILHLNGLSTEDARAEILRSFGEAELG